MCLKKKKFKIQCFQKILFKQNKNLPEFTYKMANGPLSEIEDDLAKTRLKEFSELEPWDKPFTVDIVNDTRLYQLAVENGMEELVKVFVRALRNESFANIIRFINSVPINKMENYVDRSLKIFILNLLNFANTEELANSNIDPDISSMHQHFRYHQLALLECRSDMLAVDKGYRAPFVMIRLEDDIEGYVAKYFNGVRWCRLQANDEILNHLSSLTMHQYAIVGDRLFFLSNDGYLCILHLLHDTPLLKFLLPQPVPQDAQLCVDQNKVILLDSKRNIVELIQREGELMFDITDWRKISKREYRLLNANKMLQCFEIETEHQPGKISVCYSRNYNGDRLSRMFSGILYSFRINSDREYKEQKVSENHIAYEIPEDSREDCHYALMERKVLEEYINRLSHSKSKKDVKRRLDFETDLSSTKRKPMRNYSTEKEMTIKNFGNLFI